MYERQLPNLGTESVLKNVISLPDQKPHDRLKGSGHATNSELSIYFGISPRLVPKVLEGQGIKINRARRVSWSEVWDRLWNIRSVPAPHHDIMRRPLFTVDEVVERAGVSSRSILRDANRARPHYGLPRFTQLSARCRRYHPEMVHLWEMELPLEDWMRPIKRRSRSGLKPRLSGTFLP